MQKMDPEGPKSPSKKRQTGQAAFAHSSFSSLLYIQFIIGFPTELLVPGGCWVLKILERLKRLLPPSHFLSQMRDSEYPPLLPCSPSLCHAQTGQLN